MPRATPLISSLNAGEISPLVQGRLELRWFRNACRKLQNMVTTPQGPAKRRPGTRFAVEVEDSSRKTRVIRFKFGTLQAYIIELGHVGLRFIRNRGQVVVSETDAVITNGDFAASIADWDNLSTGTASIAHDAANGRLNLVPGADGDVAWAEQDVTVTETSQLHALVFDVVGQPGDEVELRIGTMSGGSEAIADKVVATGTHCVTFTPGASPFYVQFRSSAVKVAQIDNVRLLGSGATAPVPIEVDGPWSEDELFGIGHAQSNDVLYLCHREHKVRKLLRFSDQDWSLVEVDFFDGPYLPLNLKAISITASAATGTGITLTASKGIFKPGHVGALWRLSEASGGLPFDAWVQGKAYAVGAKVRNDGKAYEATRGGTSGERSPIHDRPDEIVSDGGVSWRFLHDANGHVRITGYTSDTVVTADVKSRLPASTLAGTERWREGAWSDVQGYPVAVSFYEERLWYFGSREAPDRKWASRLTDFERFSPGPNDNDALELQAVSNETNAGLWLSPGRRLFSGTAGGVWETKSTGFDEPLTPTKSQVKQVADDPAAFIQPLRISGALLYVEDGGRILRELVPTVNQEGEDIFDPDDLTLRAEHITRAGIVDMDFAKQPWSIVWCARRDGMLLGFTYNRKQEVFAWHRHPLGGGGKVESVATIPGPAGDEVWLVVRRTIQGQTRRYIEFIEDDYNAPNREDFDGDDEAGFIAATLESMRDMFFIDSGLTYEGPPVTVITGADHLEGETVQIVADGAVHPERVVVNGRVELRKAATKVHLGLGSRAVVHPVRIEAGAVEGTAQGKQKRVSNVVVRLDRSAGFKIGREDKDELLDQTPFRRAGDPMDRAPPLFTGDKKVPFRGQYDTAGDVVVVQDLPLPLTVVALMPQLATHEG